MSNSTEAIDTKREIIQKYNGRLENFREVRLQMIRDNPFEALSNANLCTDAAESEFKKTLTTLLMSNMSGDEMVDFVADRALRLSFNLNNSTNPSRNLMNQYLLETHSLMLDYVKREEQGLRK